MFWLAWQLLGVLIAVAIVAGVIWIGKWAIARASMSKGEIESRKRRPSKRQVIVAAILYGYGIVFGCRFAWYGFVSGKPIAVILGLFLAIPASVLAWGAFKSAWWK